MADELKLQDFPHFGRRTFLNGVQEVRPFTVGKHAYFLRHSLV
jgi:hypothetical protein